MADPPKVIDPPFYDPPIADYPSGQQHSQAWTEYHQAVADQINGMQARMTTGVTDGSDAAAGQIGEYMTATGSVALATNVAANVAAIPLTAGDWDVSGNVSFSAGSGTHVFFGAGISGIDTFITATFPASAINQGISTATRRFNVTAATTVNLLAEAAFTGTVTATGTISARRIR